MGAFAVVGACPSGGDIPIRWDLTSHTGKRSRNVDPRPVERTVFGVGFVGSDRGSQRFSLSSSLCRCRVEDGDPVVRVSVIEQALVYGLNL